MSNETKSDRPITQPAQPLTRRPLKHLYFAHPYDLPGQQVTNLGESSGLVAEAPPPTDDKRVQPKHYLAWHVPALGVVELHFNPGGSGGTRIQTWEIPVANFLKWEKA